MTDIEIIALILIADNIVLIIIFFKLERILKQIKSGPKVTITDITKGKK